MKTGRNLVLVLLDDIVHYTFGLLPSLVFTFLSPPLKPSIEASRFPRPADCGGAGEEEEGGGAGEEEEGGGGGAGAAGAAGAAGGAGGRGAAGAADVVLRC